MPATYKLIGSQTLSTTTGTVTFSSIPQTYTDLKIKCSVRTAQSNFYDNLVMYFNGSNSGFTTLRFTSAWNSTPTSSSDLLTGLPYMYVGESNGNTAGSSLFADFEIYVPNYTNTVQYKTVSSVNVHTNNTTTGFSGIHQSQWSNSAAITSISFTNTSGNMLANTTISVYGIKNT